MARRKWAWLLAVVALAPFLSGTAESTSDITVTFTYLDRAGAATESANTFLFGVDTDVFRQLAPGPDGTVTTTLPAGRYHLESTVETPRPGTELPARSVLVNPELTVTSDTSVTVDATTAKPVTITVPDRHAIGLSVSVGYWRKFDRGPIAISIGSPDPTALFTAHSGPPLPGDQLTAVAAAYFARPGPDGTATNSPLVYATAWHQSGRLPTGFRKQVRESELSTVHTEHGTVAPGRQATKTTVLDLPPYGHFGNSIDYTTTPFTRVERYAGTVRWANMLDEYAPTEERAGRTTQSQEPTAYRPGRRYTERWNLAPVRPDPRVRMTGDAVVVEPALYGDHAGRTGTSAYRHADVRLYRNGHLAGVADHLDGARFPVPAGAATYRLTVTAERDFTELAAKTSTTWTFSATQAPLPAARFEPPVDVWNAAPGGRTTPIPVRVPRDTALRVTVSYDGGASWRPVRVTGTGDRRLAIVHHPAGPGLVSLRATASDSTGATVEQTVLGAYRLR